MKLHIMIFILFNCSIVYCGTFNQFKKKVIDIDSYSFAPTKRWVTINKDETKSIERLISLLKKSKTGRKILIKSSKKALEEGKLLVHLFKAGEGSLLDTTLVRRFSRSNPDQIMYENKSTIYINKEHTILNAVLDMAHELTHFTFRKPFNPYVGNFTPDQFVKSTVEGLGGEVDAYLIECRVLYELFPTSARSVSNCEKVRDSKTGKFSKKLGVKQFYKVGRHVRTYMEELSFFKLSSNKFPYLSSRTATFISSAWGLPYPLAALKEYKTIMGKVCHNDHKRLVLMKGNVSRAPASMLQGESSKKRYDSFSKNYHNRCQQFI
ncbi:MAG: hypothetical protein HN576_15155 [Bacteriovoracaceae bacterium]|jgi:hypothetical protein|nr:hypothetical protein [Bacteriovoracaceae bacterium]